MNAPILDGEERHVLGSDANVLAPPIERSRPDQALEQRIEGRTREWEQQLIAAAKERAVLEERQRLARDLHDSVTQALYGITLHAQAARRLLAAGEVATALDSLRAVQDTAQEALDEMRLLIFELRPPILEQVGLVAALEARLHAVEGRANLQTRLIVDGGRNLPALVEQALYRIATEALNNVLKHAHARHISVWLHQTETHVLLEITDDGVGFELVVARESGGMGLWGIAERAAQRHGTFSLQSAPGAGTRLRVEIAL
jgi:signal transduction histidine kinase